MCNVYIWEVNYLLIICYINNVYSNSIYVYVFVYMYVYGKMMVFFKIFCKFVWLNIVWLEFLSMV